MEANSQQHVLATHRSSTRIPKERVADTRWVGVGLTLMSDLDEMTWSLVIYPLANHYTEPAAPTSGLLQLRVQCISARTAVLICGKQTNSVA
jgi:hypothetical protein